MKLIGQKAYHQAEPDVWGFMTENAQIFVHEHCAINHRKRYGVLKFKGQDIDLLLKNGIKNRPIDRRHKNWSGRFLSFIDRVYFC